MVSSNRLALSTAFVRFGGGTHVNSLADKLAKSLVDAIKKKNKMGAPVKTFQIKNHMFLFINSLVENPSFDSQTKETLTSKPSTFGSTINLSDSFLKAVSRSGLVDHVLTWARAKSEAFLKKAHGGSNQKKSRINGIPKLDDANKAGTREAKNCTLILTEGDSAKALAVSGLGVIGRDYYGVFPLRGKLLNVRDAGTEQVADNKEISNILKIMGLSYGRDYNDINSLRYGHLMIMTDQDHDGSHIKGLLINFVHKFWPNLLKLPGFLTEFITPIVKASKGNQELCFFTMPEYEKWRDETPQQGWRLKYYKGLGTSTSNEAKQYFSDLQRHKIDFVFKDENDNDAIDLVFSKKRADQRKDWLRSYNQGDFLDQDVDTVNYSDFINKELILFSLADCERSIPALMDGLKPGQRKILFSCFKRNLVNEIKVAQLSGYVSEQAAYHHGEMSLQSSVVNMAQNFVGSNNINLLFPSGQFGTRLQGGKDSASSRYIYTRLCQLTRFIFHKSDDPVLEYLNEEGLSIEPKWFLPIIPMVLINGAEGIGTGWRTTIPNYNPRDVVANIKRLIHGEEMVPMMPWYKGFKGTIIPEPNKSGSYKTIGTWKRREDDPLIIDITELPIKTWTQNFKDLLETLVSPSDKKLVKDYKEYHTEETVHFEIHFESEISDEDFEKTFKMTSMLNTTNMHLFGLDGAIRKFHTPEDIIREYYPERLDFYQKRKEMMINELTDAWKKLDNKVRFILAVINKTLKINNRKRADILADLNNMEFEKISSSKQTKKVKKEAAAEENTNEETRNTKKLPKSDYDYLLNMPLWSLTMERVNQLTSERDGKRKELEIILETSAKTMWLTDLDEFLSTLDIIEEAEREQLLNPGKGKKRVLISKRKSTTTIPAGGRKRKSKDEDEDFVFEKPKRPRAPRKKKEVPLNTQVPVPVPVPVKIEETPMVTKPKVKKKEEHMITNPKMKKEEPMITKPKMKKEEMTLMERLAIKKQQSILKALDSSEKNTEPSKIEKDEPIFTDLEKRDEEILLVTKPKVQVQPKKTPATKRKVPPKKKSEMDKTIPKKKAKAAPVLKKRATHVIDDSFSESEEDTAENLKEEIPPKKAPAKKTLTKAAPARKKRAAHVIDDSFSESEEDTGENLKEHIPPKKVPAKKKPKKVAPVRKKRAAHVIDDSFSESESESEENTSINLQKEDVNLPTKRQASKRNVKRIDYSKWLADESSDDEFLDESF